MCGNIKHFTLLVVKRCHWGKYLRRRLTNPVNRKFQIVQKQEYFLHIIKWYLRAVRCPTLLWCDPNIVTGSGWKEKKSRKTSTVVIKTCQPYLFQTTWSTIEKNRFLPLVDATHQDFPVGENFHIAKVSVAELRKLFTYLLTDAQPPKTGWCRVRNNTRFRKKFEELASPRKWTQWNFGISTTKNVRKFSTDLVKFKSPTTPPKMGERTANTYS